MSNKRRISQDLNPGEIWEIVTDYGPESDFMFDYEFHLAGREHTTSRLYDFCKQVAIEFVGDFPTFNAGDNTINLAWGLYDHITNWLEEQAERESSRRNE